MSILVWSIIGAAAVGFVVGYVWGFCDGEDAAKALEGYEHG